MDGSVIRTAIVEDQLQFCEGLATLINRTNGYRCTGAFRTIEEALEGIKREVPDIALCDLVCPG
jgi:DNA-binding NarL/FixJ family response regulator